MKEKYAHVLYEQEGQAVLASETFQSFFAQNEAWLFPYACYCFLRDREGNADFTRWGTYQYYEESNLRRLVKDDPEAKKATEYWYFIQFLLHQQFTMARDYAHEGVALKGIFHRD